jgi:hypothetical protein
MQRETPISESALLENQPVGPESGLDTQVRGAQLPAKKIAVALVATAF